MAFEREDDAQDDRDDYDKWARLQDVEIEVDPPLESPPKPKPGEKSAHDKLIEELLKKCV